MTKDDKENIFKKIRQKRSEILIGLPDRDMSDENIRKIVTDTEKAAQEYWKTMTFKDDKVWEDLDIVTGTLYGSHTTYVRLNIMAQAYCMEETALYQNKAMLSDIIKAMEFVLDNRLVKEERKVDDWWYREIGVPIQFNDIFILLYDELPKTMLDKYMQYTQKQTPSPYVCWAGEISTGANRLWTCKVVALHAVLTDDEEKLICARDAISDVFSTVKIDDGFYKDGSFIQHHAFSYTGGYGMSLLTEFTYMATLLADTPFAVSTYDLKKICRLFDAAYEPIAYRGEVMVMTRGRELARIVVPVAGLVRVMAMLSAVVPEPYSSRLAGKVKLYLEDKLHYNVYENVSIYINGILKNALQGDAKKAEPLDIYHQYSSMDRAVQHRPGYAFGISMYSDRTQNYEMGNGENVKGWHTADGMTYLYNDDLMQYFDGYWPTVDKQRLAGTTVVAGAENKYYMIGTKWCGGVEAGNFGMTSMLLAPKGQKLEAKKSYFLFDDEMVAIGTVNSADGETVETIIDNRKINSEGNNRFEINGESFDGMTQKDAQSVKWMHLEGNAESDDIGYYIPQAGAVKILRESRTDTWKSINTNESYADKGERLTRNFMTFWFDHGKNPKNAAYAYVVLPGKTAKQTQAYSENPDTEILSNTAQVHAVRENKLKMTAATFWESAILGELEAKTALSVIKTEKGGDLILKLSDITQKEKKITLVINRSDIVLKTADSTVGVTYNTDSVTVDINTEGSSGKTHTVTFKAAADDEKRTDIPFPAVCKRVSLEIEKAVLTVGEEAYLTVQGEMTDASFIEYKNANISYSVSNKDVVEIIPGADNDLKTLLKAKSCGRSVITAFIEDNGQKTEVSRKVQVADKVELDPGWYITHYGIAEGEGRVLNGNVTLKTNGFDYWRGIDDGAIAYRKITLPGGVDDYFEILAKIDEIPFIGSSGSGVIIRSKDIPDSAHVMLRAQNGGLNFIVRDKGGGDSTCMGFGEISLPLEVKLTMSNGLIEGFKKNAQGEWEKLKNETQTGEAQIEIGTDFVAGIAAYSGSPLRKIETKASDVVIRHGRV